MRKNALGIIGGVVLVAALGTASFFPAAEYTGGGFFFRVFF